MDRSIMLGSSHSHRETSRRDDERIIGVKETDSRLSGAQEGE